MVNKKLLNFIGNANNIVVPFSYHNYYSNNGTNKRILNELVKDSTVNFENLLFYREEDKLIFVDGMERFTTVYLLLCALSSKLYENNQIEEYSYILNNYILSEENNKVLNLRDNDDNDLKMIVDALCKDGYLSEYETNSSPILRTYSYFIEVLDNRRSSRSTQHYNINNTYSNLSKIKCEIGYVSSQDVHKKFNQLNEQSLINKYMCNVLIKNYFLDNLYHEHIPDFKIKWSELEDNFSKYPYANIRKNKYFDYFLKIYFNVKLDFTPNYNELYQVFLEYSDNKNLKDIYEDIYKYSTYYNDMFHRTLEDEKLNTCFNNITKCCFTHRLDNTKLPDGNTLYSNEKMQVFLLKVYDDYQKSILSKEELIFITKIIENYVVRRDLCDITSDNLNNIFIQLYNDINKKEYVNSFINEIISLQKEYIFPNDDKLRGELLTHDFYKEKDINKYILDELENSLHYTPKDNLDEYQIEHIMPRTLSKSWYEELGDDADKINSEYVNTIGNLTLLKKSANIALSNKSFHDKVNNEDIGYKYSDIKLSDDVIKAEKWNENAIKKRSARLTEQIIKLWYYPNMNKQVDVKVEDTIPEEFDYNNQLLNDLDKRILSLDKDIQRYNTNDYTEYKLEGYSLLYLHQKDGFIECRLNINKEEIIQPEIIGKHYNYNDKVKCFVNDNTDIDYTISLIEQIIPLVHQNNVADENIINDFEYQIDYYPFNDDIKQLFTQLQSEINNLDTQITQNNNKYYISFKINNHKIVDVYPYQDYLDLNIKLPTEYLNEEELNSINFYDYYEKTINVFYEDKKQTSMIIKLVKKAYKYINGNKKVKTHTDKQKYSLEYLGMKKGTLTRELIDELNKEIKKTYTNLIQKNTSAYVAYKKDRKNLIYIYNEKSYLKINIAVKPDKIPDKLKIRGKYDEERDFIAYVDELEDIENTMRIIEKAYEIF